MTFELAGLVFVVVVSLTGFVAWKTSSGTPLRKNPDQAVFDPKDAFARKVIRALKKRGYERAYYDAFSYSVRLADGSSKPLAKPWADVGERVGADMDPVVEAWLSTWAKQDPNVLRTQFVTAMRLSFKEAGLAATYDDEAFAFQIGEGMTFALEHAFSQYSGAADAEERDLHIRRYVAGARLSQQVPDSWDSVSSRVHPRVIHEAYIGGAMLHAATAAAKAGNEPPPYPCASVGGGLLLEVVLDEEVAIRPLAGLLQEWGVTLQTALDQALQNFMTGEVPLRHFENGLLGTAWGNHMEQNSLLLPQEFWDQLPLEGVPVVWPASATATLIGGGDDPDLCVKLVAAVRKVVESERRMSCYPVHRGEDGMWSRWRPDPKLAGARELTELVSALMAIDYNSQQDAISDWFAAQKLSAHFVSALTAAGSDERAFTYAVWPPIPTVLPPADRVMVVGDDLEGVFVDWADFKKIVGDRLTPIPGLLPERFSLDGACKPEHWQALLAGGGEAMGHVEPAWEA